MSPLASERIRHYRALARVGVDAVAESFTDRVDATVSASAVNRDLAAALACALRRAAAHIMINHAVVL